MLDQIGVGSEARWWALPAACCTPKVSLEGLDLGGTGPGRARMTLRKNIVTDPSCL